ncbi:MAG: GspI family T2SS minor pseudopilin variant LspI [Tatlockia sp.]|jgi:general secretion pathway protein I
MKKQCTSGFTLIEVLLALAVIAIALTALVKATASNVSNTQRIKEKTISHWVAMQGITMFQLRLLSSQQPEETHLTTLLGQRWYWRSQLSATPVKSVQQITVTVSKHQEGPFGSPLIGYRLNP